MTQLLTNSRLSCNRRCQRLHHLKYTLGYRPTEDADALRFGTLVHLGLAAWWRCGVVAERLRAALDAMAAAPNVDPYDAAKAEAMMTGYDARWGAEQLETLGVEVPFETELRNPETGMPSRSWRLAGKLDALARDKGRVYVVEHKTSSSDVGPGSDYWKRLRMDGQVSVYYAGAKALGHDVAGCLYDVLGKPGQRPLQVNSKRAAAETPEEYRVRVMAAIAEDPDKYYQRGVVVRLEKEEAEAMADVWASAQQMLDGRAPRNPDGCVMYNQTCAFFGVCTGEASLDNPEHFKRLTNINPELT